MVQFDSFQEIWERVKRRTDLSTLTQLAELVGTTHQYVSRKKTKNEFPTSWAFSIAQKYGLSTDWIMTGLEPRRLEGIKNDLAFYEELEAWARETGRSEDIQWLRNQIESFFPMFTEWKKRRAEGDEVGDEFPSSKVA